MLAIVSCDLLHFRCESVAVGWQDGTESIVYLHEIVALTGEAIDVGSEIKYLWKADKKLYYDKVVEMIIRDRKQ